MFNHTVIFRKGDSYFPRNCSSALCFISVTVRLILAFFFHQAFPSPIFYILLLLGCLNNSPFPPASESIEF